MLCLATAIHNIKWLKITHIYLIWDQTFPKCFNNDFILNNRFNNRFNRIIKLIKNGYKRDQQEKG